MTFYAGIGKLALIYTYIVIFLLGWLAYWWDQFYLPHYPTRIRNCKKNGIYRKYEIDF
jgi:hypothetical protein